MQLSILFTGKNLFVHIVVSFDEHSGSVRFYTRYTCISFVRKIFANFYITRILRNRIFYVTECMETPFA